MYEQQHLHPTTPHHEIPDELTCFDVQEVDGVLIGRVGVAELREALDWLSGLTEVGHV
jgi:hypothetical protein